MGCLFPFYSLKMEWITLTAEGAQIKIFQCCWIIFQNGVCCWASVEQAIRMNYNVSVTNLSERKPDATAMPCWEKDNFQHKIIKLPVIALRKHIQIKGWGTCYCLRTTFFSIVWKAFIVHEISLCCLPSRGIENILIRNGKINLLLYSFMKYLMSESH